MIRLDHPLLSEEEERNLLFKKDDPISREKLILSNMKLVKKIVKRFPNNPDVFNEGIVGLIEAIDKFDVSEGTKLSTYATYWIKCRCFEWVLNNNRMLKMPGNMDKKKIFFQIGKAKSEIQKDGEEDTVANLADRMIVNEKDVEEMMTRMQHDVWLDRPIGGEEDGVTLGDVLEGIRVEEQIINNQKSRILHSYIKLFKEKLNHNEQFVLKERIFNEKKLRDVGESLSLTTERVRQIEEQVRNKFKDFSDRKKMSELI